MWSVLLVMWILFLTKYNIARESKAIQNWAPSDWTKAQSQRPTKGIHVAGEYIEVSNKGRNIGVIFDSHVNLEKHVMNTCKTAFYHLRKIAKIRNCLPQQGRNQDFF